MLYALKQTLPADAIFNSELALLETICGYISTVLRESVSIPAVSRFWETGNIECRLASWNGTSKRWHNLR